MAPCTNQTGNIDFNGDVIIHGPITSGFTVQAGGDVFVAGTVDDGIKIIAQGDVAVSRSISGKRTLVKAGKTLRAQIVNEALVMAGQKNTPGELCPSCEVEDQRNYSN